MLALQIGRQRRVRARRVAPAESLPGEIIVGDGEVAGEPLDPLAEHRADAARRIAGQRLVLRRRNAEAVQGGRLLHHPADERLVEDRREALFVEPALLLERPRLENVRRVETVQPGERMARPEEMAEQAVAVEVAGEHADAPPSERAALVPVGAGGRVELQPQGPVVDADIGARVGKAEEAEERVVIGQVFERRRS